MNRMSDEEILAYIKRMHTKQLLQLLQSIRKLGGDGVYLYGNYGTYVSTDVIREELSTREHIPNKLQARLIRQRKALNGRRGKKTNRRRKVGNKAGVHRRSQSRNG